MEFSAEFVTTSIGYLTGKAHRALREGISAELARRGVQISATFIPFLGHMVVCRKETITQRELGDLLELDRHRISRAMKEMEAAGWVWVRENPNNKRENLVSLSPDGMALIKTIGACAREIIDRAYQGISAEERAVTERTLQRIIDNLNEK